MTRDAPLARSLFRHLPGVLAVLAMLAAGAFFCDLAVLRYLSHHADAFDMGIEDQMMWSTLHGKLFGITLERRLTTSYLGYHFEPISLIGPLLYLIYASPISLIVLKNVVVSLGAIPAFWLARRHLRSGYAGLVFSLVYLLFPGLEAAQLYDWHAYTLTAPLLLAAFCFFDARRYGWMVVFLALSAATKENSPLDAVPLGVYLFAMRRQFRLGSALAGFGFLWFGIATYLIIPHYNAEGQNWLWTRYGGMGGSPLGAIAHFVDNPRALLAPVPDDPNWRYLALLLAPVAWLTLLSPTTLFLMVPALAVNLLTTYEPMHLIETYHYSAHLVPFVLLGAIYGIGTIANGFDGLAKAGVRVGRRSFSVSLHRGRYSEDGTGAPLSPPLPAPGRGAGRRGPVLATWLPASRRRGESGSNAARTEPLREAPGEQPTDWREHARDTAGTGPLRQAPLPAPGRGGERGARDDEIGVPTPVIPSTERAREGLLDRQPNRLESRSVERGPLGTAVVWTLATLVLLATLVYHYYRGYTPLSGEFVGYQVTAHDRLGDQLARQVATMVPLADPISAQSNLYPHVDHRPQIFMFPEVSTAHLIFLDVATLPNTTGIDEGIHDRVQQVIDAGTFGPVVADDGYLILQRGAPKRPLPDAFYSFARATAPRPSHPLDVLFGDKLELLGFDVIPGRDGKVDLRAYWRARAPVQRDLFLTFFITDGAGHEKGAALHREPANVWYPTNRWKPGEIVQITTYNLPVGRRGQDFGVALGVQPGADPFDTSGRKRPLVLSAPHPMRTPGQGALLEVVTFQNDHDLLRENTGESSPAEDTETGARGTTMPPGHGDAVLGNVASGTQEAFSVVVSEVANFVGRIFPRVAGPTAPGPAPDHRLDVAFERGIGLEGYSLTDDSGRQLDLTLFWRASGATPIPYTVFAHVVDRAGKLVAQHDSPPDGGLKSTTAWLKGEVIADHLAIPIPAGRSLDGTRLEVGLYDPVSGQRLTATVDGKTSDHVEILRLTGS